MLQNDELMNFRYGLIFFFPEDYNYYSIRAVNLNLDPESNIFYWSFSCLQRELRMWSLF